MERIEFFINDERSPRFFEGDPETPLLWVIRDALGLTGTKYGCGMALCGVCTVHFDNLPIRSCVKRIGDVKGGRIRTIEGLHKNNDYHPVQKAWVELNVPQCGYCQSGQLMSAAALVDTCKAQGRMPTDEDINVAMSGNLCRCGTYPRIREAIKQAAKK